MSHQPIPLVLASASPRRREILELLGIDFRPAPVEVDEGRAPGEAAEDYVIRVAEAKALASARRHAGEEPPPFVLAADTAVVLDGAVLGKPRDEADARAMLMGLAGRTHRVLTGIAAARAGRGVLLSEAVAASVRFRELDAATVARYVASGECADKAGAYAVQGLGAALVESIDGPYHTVVGLPAAQTVALLTRVGALQGWP